MGVGFRKPAAQQLQVCVIACPAGHSKESEFSIDQARYTEAATSRNPPAPHERMLLGLVTSMTLDRPFSQTSHRHADRHTAGLAAAVARHTGTQLLCPSGRTWMCLVIRSTRDEHTAGLTAADACARTCCALGAHADVLGHLGDQGQAVQGGLVDAAHLIVDEQAGQQHRQREDLRAVLARLQGARGPQVLPVRASLGRCEPQDLSESRHSKHIIA